MSPEQALWTAVLHQAFADARRPLTREQDQYDFDRARRWFRVGGRHFQDVCHMAGCDPEYVRDKALAMIAANPLPPKPEVRTGRVMWTEEEAAIAVRLRAEGLSEAMIADEIGRTKGFVKSMFRTLRERVQRAA